MATTTKSGGKFCAGPNCAAPLSLVADFCSQTCRRDALSVLLLAEAHYDELTSEEYELAYDDAYRAFGVEAISDKLSCLTTVEKWASHDFALAASEPVTLDRLLAVMTDG